MSQSFEDIVASIGQDKKPTKPTVRPGKVFGIVNEGDPSKWSLDVLPELETAYQARFGRKPRYGRVGQGSGVGGWDHRNNVDFSDDPDTPEGQFIMDWFVERNLPFRAATIGGRHTNAQGRTTSTGKHIHGGPGSRSFGVKRQTPAAPAAPVASFEDIVGQLDPPVEAPPITRNPTVPPTTNPDGTLTQTFTPGQSYFLQPGQELPQRRARRAGGAVSSEPYTPEPVTVTYAPGQGDVVDVPEGMDVVTGRQRTVGPSVEAIKERARQRAQMIRQRVQQKLQREQFEANNTTSVVPNLPLLTRGLTPEQKLKVGVQPRLTKADLNRAEDPVWAEMRRREINEIGRGAAYTPRVDEPSIGPPTDTRTMAEKRAPIVEREQRMQAVRDAIYRDAEADVALATGLTRLNVSPQERASYDAAVGKYVTERLKVAEGAIRRKPELLQFDPQTIANRARDIADVESDVTPIRNVRRDLREVGESLKEGVVSTAGSGLQQLGALADVVNVGPGKSQALKSAGEALRRTGSELQEGQQVRDIMQPGGKFNRAVLRGAGATPGTIAEFATLGPVAMVAGGALARQQEGPWGMVKGAAETATTLGGMHLTGKVLSPVMNAITWTTLPTIKGVVEGKEFSEALGESIPMGALAGITAQGREAFMRSKGYEPYVFKSADGRTASVYVNAEGQFYSLRVRDAGRGNRPRVEVTDEVFNRITAEGKVGKWTRGVANANNVVEMFRQSPAAEMGSAPPVQRGIAPALRQIAGRVEPIQPPAVVEPTPPTSPARPIPAPDLPLGVPGMVSPAPTIPEPVEAKSADLTLEDFTEQVHQPKVDAYLKAQQKYEMAEGLFGKDSEQARMARDEMTAAEIEMGSQLPQVEYATYQKKRTEGGAPVVKAETPKQVIRHADPKIDGGEIIGKTNDGRLKVQNNEGGVSVVKNPRTSGNRNAAIQKVRTDEGVSTDAPSVSDSGRAIPALVAPVGRAMGEEARNQIAPVVDVATREKENAANLV